MDYMNPAPEKKDDDGTPQKKSSFLCYGILNIILGLGLIGTVFPVLADFENYVNIRDPLLETDTDLALALYVPPLLILGGVLYLSVGALGIAAYCLNSSRLLICAFVICVVTSGLTATGGTVVTLTIEDLLDKLAGNPVTDDTFSDGEIAILDFTAAIYNECCLSQYDSRDYAFGDVGQQFRGDNEDEPVDDNQRAVKICGENLEETCPTDPNDPERMFPEIVTDLINELGFDEANDFICHCFGDQERFDKFVEILQRDNLCDAYRNVIVEDVDDIEVPIINQPFGQIVSLLRFNRPEIAEELPMVRFALVGKMIPPASIYQEPAEDIGWSCGLGYAKSLAFTLYLYIDGITKPSLIGGIVSGALGLTSTLIVFVITFFGINFSVDDEDGYGYASQGDENDPYADAPKPKKKAPVDDTPTAEKVTEEEKEEITV